MIHGNTRRGISEIIASLMLLAITVVGAMLIWTLFSGSNAFQIGANIVSSQSTSGGIKIIGYDTRNGCALSGISIINNNVDTSCVAADSDGNKLCTTSCPANGNDYIVLTVRNPNTRSVTINSIQINEITHSFDISNAGTTLDSTGKLPAAGKFKIIPPPTTPAVTLTISSSPIVEAGADARLIVRLSGSINPDIVLEKPIRVIVDITDFEPTTFTILSGSAR